MVLVGVASGGLLVPSGAGSLVPVVLVEVVLGCSMVPHCCVKRCAGLDVSNGLKPLHSSGFTELTHHITYLTAREERRETTHTA